MRYYCQCTVHSARCTFLSSSLLYVIMYSDRFIGGDVDRWSSCDVAVGRPAPGHSAQACRGDPAIISNFALSARNRA